MNEVITTKSVGSGIAEVEEDFILHEEPMSRLVFHAQIHARGIRGRIIRQRRESASDTWVPEKAIPIRQLGKNETINLDVNTDALEKFYLAIQQLTKILEQNGVQFGKKEYAVVDPNSLIITDTNKANIIHNIIDGGYGEEVWDSLAESDPSLATKLSYARIQGQKKGVVEEFKNRLDSGMFLETSGDDSWQKWIYKNNWLFGVNYQKPLEKVKINVRGVMPDYLFPTSDGFIDILEIKLPEEDVIHADTSHPGSWRWAPKANDAIGQVVNYLGEIDRLRLEIEAQIKRAYDRDVCLLRPRAYILIGNSADWNSDKKEGLRKMNHVLHGVEVLTYQDLIDRGSQTLTAT